MAWYKTGTVAVTNASTTVTGAGTNFVSGAQVGDGFLGPNELLYEITAINSATSLTIAPAYGGATASSQSYAIAPTQGLVASLASDVTDLITDYQSVVDNAGAGKFGDGSAASPAIRFTNDQDTGFFRDTANEIAFATAGVKRGEFTSSGIQLLDGQKFIAGTGSDLSIFHNGSSSLIEDSGTGGLTIRSNLLTVQNAAGNETVAQFVQDGFVKLFHNNSQVFTTTSSGASITGSLGIDTSDLGGTAGDSEESLRLTTSNTNSDKLVFTNERLSTATTWTSAAHRIQRVVDASKMGYIQFGHPASDLITFGEGTTERMRISGGNLLVGTTSTTLYDGDQGEGFAYRAGNELTVARSGAAPLTFVRQSDDGTIINFKKDTASVGSIGAAGGDIYVGTGDTTLKFADGADLIAPTGTNGTTRDGIISLGNGSNRFKDLYLSGGVFLGGTGSANKLDDYEYGTWTPSMNAYSGSVSSHGEYFKVGDMVTASFSITLDGTTDASPWRIANLPFNWDNAVGGSWGGCITKQDAGLDGHSFQVVTTNDVLIYNSSGATRSYTNVGVNSNIRGVVTYKTT